MPATKEVAAVANARSVFDTKKLQQIIDMANAAGITLQDAMPKQKVADIEYMGEKIILPTGLKIEEAIGILKNRLEYDNKATNVTARFEYAPYDCAHALNEVIRRKFGWVSMETIPGFWEDHPPQLIEVPVGVDRVASVPWGRIQLFKDEGHIDTQVNKVAPGKWAFFCNATVLRKHEATVKAIYEEVRIELARNSIYRGKAIAAEFHTADGIPEIKFVDVTSARKDQLIFSKEVNDAIETNLFMPIERMKDIEACGMPTKYGVLLAGTFGVGKTLAARVAANLAIKNDITFIYVKSASQLRDALAFAQQYQPACVFCEDIDRTLSGERTEEMDSVLNIIDGIDTKRAKIVTILTTNDLTTINPATVRPGRLDAVIEVTTPDAEATEKLIRMYGGADIDPTATLFEVAKKLAGNIPAIIEEVVKRSKRSALRRTKPGDTNIKITDEALAEAASTMDMQLRLLNPEPQKKEKTINDLIVDATREGTRQYHEE